jgi:hypothetical protein
MAQKKLFAFAKERRARPKNATTTRAQKLKDESDSPPYFVRGRQADSKDEYWVSLALDKIQDSTGWAWDYQVPVYGGKEVRGGNVVDFLVHTPGMWTALDPQGRYWHTGVNEDQNQMQNVARKKGWRLLAWFTDETPSRDEVYIFLKRELNV